MTAERFKPLLDRDFLQAELNYEFADYLASGDDDQLLERLQAWSRRELKRETQAEASFVQRFFIETWGYRDDGTGTDSFQLHPKFPIAGAGQTGNRGEADLAVGTFTSVGPHIPQVVCEFKGIKSALDAPQNRKGNNRSPVMQARDYLWNARRGIFDTQPCQPRFAIVTDMDEFRLYWQDSFPDRYLRFTITNRDLFGGNALVDAGNEARFDRFLFWRLFRADMLLSDAGRTRLERLIEKQGKESRKLEGEFYKHYRLYREVLIRNITLQRPAGMTRGGAVRLGQKLLDRLIFIMFAEDMGPRVGFPLKALRDQLQQFSNDKFLEAEGDEVWRRLCLFFKRMNTGGDLGNDTIHQFNGGLFAGDAAIDSLKLPNRLFVRYGQARNDATLAEHPDTLLFLSTTYSFASEGDARNSIGLYTLGHIFEQSIVELEKLEADAEGRTSLTDITKRKRDGVYYTPEWVVTRIIEETVDPLFAEWKRDAGWAEGAEPTSAAVAAYWTRLQSIKVIDPACGSGAFLIVALRHLQREFEATIELALKSGVVEQRPPAGALTRNILTSNLFGVDINSASVEITKLSLWLHTAAAKEPLSSLDGTIQCGNSLVDSRFYNKRDLHDADDRDRINTFDWEGDFALGSFDAVIGNPPYVKLQNFRKVNGDMADWLLSGSTGAAPYISTSTGNFDLYLPFIEKGLSLLNEHGRMGYIAPNLWPTLEYGEALRGLVHAGRHLEKWLDFRSHQVFEEATVYTAIQIFSKRPSDGIRLAFVGDGDISRVDWQASDNYLPYADIRAPLKPWLIAPTPVRHMIERLAKDATRLDDSGNTKAIFQGVITSADHIFHLRRLGRNRYAFTPRQGSKKLAEVEVEIEDALMKPLVSGVDAKRFIEPHIEMYLLFPYRLDPAGAKLISVNDMLRDFPKAWSYLKLHESELSNRENGKFNDPQWYRMGRSQNLDKQETVKLLVPRLVANLGCFIDDNARYYCDNVDVGGVVPQRPEDVWWLAGLLNSPTHNLIFSWLTKPFRGEYKSANKQFIAPLPVPNGDRASRAALSALSAAMQTRRTDRVSRRADLDERLAATARVRWPLENILADVRSVTQIEESAPRSITLHDRKQWVDEQRQADEESSLARIDGLIRLDTTCEVALVRGKLSFLIDEIEIVRAFVGDDEAALIEAQWRAVALDFQPSGKGDAKRLIGQLRKVVIAAPPALTAQIIAIGGELHALSAELQEDERHLHELTALLFNLSPDEERMVKQGRVVKWPARNPPPLGEVARAARRRGRVDEVLMQRRIFSISPPAACHLPQRRRIFGRIDDAVGQSSICSYSATISAKIASASTDGVRAPENSPIGLRNRTRSAVVRPAAASISWRSSRAVWPPCAPT